MRPLLGVELLKLRVTPSLRAAMLAAPALALVVVAMAAVFEEAGAGPNNRTFESASAGRIAILVLGVLAVGGEFHHRTIASVFSAFPRRVSVMGAKALVIGGAGALAGAVAVVAGDALGAVILAARSVDIDVSAGHLVGLGLSQIAVCVMWGLAGVAIGAVAASQSGGLMLAFGSLLANSAVEGPLGTDLARFLPIEATEALMGAGQEGSLPAGVAAVVLGVWVSALMAAATWRVTRLDVT